MKKTVLFLLLSCSAFWGYSQTAPAIPDNAQAASDAFFKALVDENAQALDKLVTPDFVIVNFDGELVDSGTLKEGVSGGYLVLESGSISGKYTRNFGDTGITTGIWAAKGTLSSNNFNMRLSFTTVSVKQGGFWKIASVHLTPIP